MNCATLPEHLNFDFNRCILLVDDERNHRMLLNHVLRELGFSRFMFATNGLEALEVHREHKSILSLVISDLKMPGMNGDQLFWRLNKEENPAPVILCSGLPDWDAIHLMEKAGLKAFLQKPYSRPQLVSALEKAYSVTVSVDPQQGLQMTP